ncbi:MAG: FG-GAP repeat protein [Gammaproteobacteria bacterium]
MGGLPLQACFTSTGVHFTNADAKPFALRLAAWGRGSALHSVALVKPVFADNRVSYPHRNVTEWWRVLPLGFEQGFTIAKRPTGHGELMLALAANNKANLQDAGAPGGTLAFGRLRYGGLVVTDATDRIVPSRLTTKDGRIRIAVDDADARYPLTVDPLVWLQQEVTAGDLQTNAGFFGFSVTLEGSTALIGAFGSDIAGPSAGAVFVFTESHGTWSQTATLTASDGGTGNCSGFCFGFWVALSGSTALIGEPFANVGGNIHQGAAYVFTESNGTWSQTAKLTASDGATANQFGRQVALSGNTALLGAAFATVGGNDEQGAAYVFTKSGGTWSQTAKLIASDGAAGDKFGRELALLDNTALIGAPYANVGRHFHQGAAYVFTESGGTWSQTAKLTASDGGANDLFGRQDALSGNTALVGAEQATVGSNQFQGAAYMFTKSRGTWNQTAKLTASDGAAGDYFGREVAISGNTALVGAPFATVGGNTAQGAAYVFTESDNAWNQTAKLTANDGAVSDQFSRSVALVGSTAIVGAPFVDVGGYADQGAAYFFAVSCPRGYSEHAGALNAGGLYNSPLYQAPAGLESGILGGPAGFQLYARYSNGSHQQIYRIPGNEIHKRGHAGTYSWGVKAGSTGGDYVLCILHP